MPYRQPSFAILCCYHVFIFICILFLYVFSVFLLLLNLYQSLGSIEVITHWHLCQWFSTLMSACYAIRTETLNKINTVQKFREGQIQNEFKKIQPNLSDFLWVSVCWYFLGGPQKKSNVALIFMQTQILLKSLLDWTYSNVHHTTMWWTVNIPSIPIFYFCFFPEKKTKTEHKGAVTSTSHYTALQLIGTNWRFFSKK